VDRKSLETRRERGQEPQFGAISLNRDAFPGKGFTGLPHSQVWSLAPGWLGRVKPAE
jgi:hypothetical protein